MSIQSNINQGVSLMSMLASQTPQAAERRANKEVEADIAKSEMKRKYKEQQDLKEATADYTLKQALVKDYDRSKKGTPGGRSEGLKEHILTRQTAYTAGKRLLDLAPNEELAKTLGKYQEDITELNSQIKFNEQKNIQNKINKEVAKKVKEKEAAAKSALAVEQERISNTPSFDFGKLHPDTMPYMERAYKKAMRDTKRINKAQEEQK